MNEIQRLHHINLMISAENNVEFFPQCLSFYKDFLGMTGLHLAPFIRALSHEDHVESLKAFGDDVYPLGDKRMDCEVWFLRGDDNSPIATNLDFLTYSNPYKLSSAPQSLNELGLRNFTLLVDNVDAYYKRGLEQGVEFITEPVTDTLPELGEVRFVVVKDPIGSQIELIQTADVPVGSGNPVRIFSENINCRDVEKSLGFYRDVLGMKLEKTVALDGASNIGTAMGLGEDISATTYYLRGHDENAPTYLTLTGWRKPTIVIPQREDGYSNSWFRILLWANVEDVVNGPLYERTKDLEGIEYLAPPHHWVDDTWGDSCFGIFYDYDGVMVELGYSSTWRSDYPGENAYKQYR